MNEIIIDAFLSMTPAEHISYHDDVLLHLQGKFLDMANITLSDCKDMTYRAWVNEIYLSESKQQRGINRLQYTKSLKLIVVGRFETGISDLEILSKLIIKLRALDMDIPSTVITQCHYVLAKLASVLVVLEKILSEQEITLANHSLSRAIDKIKREMTHSDAWKQVWMVGESKRDQIETISFHPIDSIPKKRKHV